MTRKTPFALFSLLPVLMASLAAQAQVSRVFVAARTGSDANSCNDVSTPCRTFAGALGQVAAGGEVIVLESGGYGPMTITKAVNVNAPTGIVAFIHPPTGDAITINAGPADTVILRGLTLNGGTNNGITANTVGQLFVEQCTITGFAFDGIDFAAPGGTLFMRDDDVRTCANIGVVVESFGTPVRAAIRDTRFSSNGTGLLVWEGSIVTATDCVAAGNITGFGAQSRGSLNADLTLDRVLAVSNVFGVSATQAIDLTGTAIVRLSNSLVAQNKNFGVATSGGATAVVGTSPGTNVIAGNGIADTTINGLGLPTTLR